MNPPGKQEESLDWAGLGGQAPPLASLRLRTRIWCAYSARSRPQRVDVSCSLRASPDKSGGAGRRRGIVSGAAGRSDV